MTGTQLLLVEDDDLNQALVRAILARQGGERLRGAELTTAGTLAQAREVLAARHIDLVLLDMHLPDGPGLGLAAELCGRDGAGPPVIALTGAAALHRDDALAAGCAAVVGKPYRPAELCEAITAHLPLPIQAGSGQSVTAAHGVTSAHGITATQGAGVSAAAGPLTRRVGAMNASQDGHAGAMAGPMADSMAAAARVRDAATAEPPAPFLADGTGAGVDYGLLFKSAPAMWLALDPALHVVAVSDAYLRATRSERADMLGKPFGAALAGYTQGQRLFAAMGLRASLDQVNRERVPHTMEVQQRFLPRPGSQDAFETCYWQPTNVPVLGPDGSVCYIIHWVADVTSQHRDQDMAQPRSEVLRNEFVSRVSHEMRGPVNTILGFSELLGLGDLSPEHREWATMILGAAQQLGALLDDVVDLTHAQNRGLAMSVEAVPLQGVVFDALALVRPLAASLGVHLEPPPQTHHCVYADQQRLRQVLLNLLTNAVKYNHPLGKVTVSYAPQPGSRLRINIIDTGRGIASYDIGEMFAPFERLDAALAGVEGAGLGLTLSRQLVEAMGGTIGATSAPGEGSLFWVDLPLASPVAAATPVQRTESPAVTSRAYQAPKKVLYVEDMVETVRLIEHILKHRPSTSLIPAMLGSVALDLAVEHHPDVVLLDLNLPDMSGEDLLQRLKADPETSAIPVVIISADASLDRVGRLLAAGATTYLTKPIGVRDFLETLDALLSEPDVPQAQPSPGEPAQVSGSRGAELESGD